MNIRCRSILIFQKLNFLVFIYFLLLFFQVSTSAQLKFYNQINTGLNYLYNFKFKAAEAVFDKMIEKNSDNPAGYHFKSIIPLWHFLDRRNAETKSEFLDLSDSVESKCRELLNYQDDPFIYYLLGSTYSYRAMVYARDEEYLNVLWSTKESYKNLSKVLELDSSFYDAYLGLGLYNFAVSQTPPAWKWALELTDLTGDKKIGIDYLTLAANRGKLAKVEAGFYLSQVLSEFLMDYKLSEKYITSLVYRYPDNLLFRYGLALLNLNETKLKTAENYLRGIINAGDSSFVQIKIYAKYLLGNIYFIKNDFDSAKTFYSQFLNNTVDEQFKGFAALKLAYCFSFLENPDSASKYFELTNLGNEDLDEDVYAASMGKKYLEDPPGEIELNLIKIQNLVDAGFYRKAIDSSLALIQLLPEGVLRAKVYLILSDCNFKIKKFSLALDYALAVINKDESEKWMKAYACFYAARCSKELKNPIDAELFINYANNYKDYFFENRLRNSLHALLYSIHK